MSNAAEVIGKVVIGILAIIVLLGVVAGLGLILAFPIKWTWNATMPYLFSLPTITWGKAWCIHFLCGCLIKASQTNTNKS